MKRKTLISVIVITGMLVVGVFFALWQSNGQNESARNTGEKKEDVADWSIFTTEKTEDGIRVLVVGKNHMRTEGIRVQADSEENAETAAELICDGITDDMSLRWSSDNDWEDTEHWVQVSFPEQVSIGCVRLYWERLNAIQYSIEVSEDGNEWKTVAKYEEAPQEKCQDIFLDKSVTAKHMRVHVFDVNKSEEDASLYYQNVSLLELEVYDAPEDDFVVKTPIITDGEKRQLAAPVVPEKYRLELVGADYENLIDENGMVADTLSDVSLEAGYRLCREERKADLPAFQITIPGNVRVGNDAEVSGSANAESGAEVSGSANAEHDAEVSGSVNTENARILPNGYEPVEWQPFEGDYALGDTIHVFVDDDAKLREMAQIFADELQRQTGKNAEVIVSGTDMKPENDSVEGDLYLKLSEENITAEEGFQMSLGTDIGNVTVIEGKTLQGIRWGCVSFMELLGTDDRLVKGTIRDYPRYEVRGFGIDVARRPVSMDMLYQIADSMSKEKMNTLQVHLNDNQIISQSDHQGTVEGALNLYSGFRLESDITNEDGVRLTSADLFYTKEEFMEFVEYASLRGVEVVPEIDTPGHSLAFIKLFPEIGKKGDVYMADQLDLSKEQSKDLIKQVWSEYLTKGNTGDIVFGNCDVVHIGMDEYYGESDEYISYLTEMAAYIRDMAPEKTIRMWGSLSGMETDYSEVPRDIEIQLWSTQWADPQEMYEEGFKIINSQNNHLYLIPGSGYDWLNVDYLEKEWEPNVFENEERRWEIPSYSPQILGACYMLWNDMIMIDGIEITQEDVFARFEQPLSVISDKLWN